MRYINLIVNFLILITLITLIGTNRTAYCEERELFRETQGHTPPPEALEYYERGRQLYSEGRYQESIQELERALTLDPTGYILNYNLAMVYERTGDYNKAIQYLNRYRELGNLNEEETERITMTIRRLEGAKVNQPTRQNTIVETRIVKQVVTRSWGRADWLFWSFFTVGVLSLGVSSATGILAYNYYNDADDFILGQDGTYDERQDIINDADSMSLTTDILIGTGAAMLLCSAALFFFRENVEEEIITQQVAFYPIIGNNEIALGFSYYY